MQSSGERDADWLQGASPGRLGEAGGADPIAGSSASEVALRFGAGLTTGESIPPLGREVRMTEKQTPEWMGKNRKLTPAEIQEFLAEPVVARIATVDENGVPYVTPVWQEWDGEAFWIVPRERSAWVAHIKKNPNVGVSCAQDNGTYKRITAQGKAEIVFGPAPMQGRCLDVANRMAVRFLGEHGPEYLVPTYDRPRYLVKIVPTKMLSWDGVEWAKKYTEK
jgi:nitroimidazol reductase NimA-like FMN-containing flavoprotein (pyridoxamine 5'-phosphate oxidase superfamily)